MIKLTKHSLGKTVDCERFSLDEHCTVLIEVY